MSGSPGQGKSATSGLGDQSPVPWGFLTYSWASWGISPIMCPACPWLFGGLSSGGSFFFPEVSFPSTESLGPPLLVVLLLLRPEGLCGSSPGPGLLWLPNQT